jgi:hypothetical protein
LVYQSYELLKNKCRELEKDYENILAENEKIFRITQPKSPVFSKDKIQSNEIKKWFDVYLELKEKLCIEKRSREVNRMLKLRNKMLKSKEHELRLSRDLEDIIYCLWFLDKKSAREISYTISYQKTVVYSILNNIKTKLFEKIKSKN